MLLLSSSVVYPVGRIEFPIVDKLLFIVLGLELSRHTSKKEAQTDFPFHRQEIDRQCTGVGSRSLLNPMLSWRLSWKSPRAAFRATFLKILVAASEGRTRCVKNATNCFCARSVGSGPRA